MLTLNSSSRTEGQYSDKAAFVLCKTSNPSSKDLQDKQLLTGETMYESVAKLCGSWNSSRIDQNLRELFLSSIVTIFIC